MRAASGRRARRLRDLGGLRHQLLPVAAAPRRRAGRPTARRPSGRSRSIAMPGISARAGAASRSRKMRATSRSAASCSSSSSCRSRRRSRSSTRRSQRSSSRRAASTRASTSRGCGLPGSCAHLSSQMPMSMSVSSGGSCGAIDTAIVASRSIPSAVPSGQGITSKPVRSVHTAPPCPRQDPPRHRGTGSAAPRAGAWPARTIARPGRDRSGRKPTNTNERRRERCASQASPGDGTSRTRASPGPRHRLSGSETRPDEVQQGRPGRLRLRGIVGRGQHWRWPRPAVPSSARSHRSSNPVVTTARHGKRTQADIASGTAAFPADRPAPASPRPAGGYEIAHEGDRVDHPPRGGQACDNLTGVGEHQPRRKRLGQLVPARRPASSLHPRPATRTTCRSFSRSTRESGISTMGSLGAKHGFISRSCGEGERNT